VGTAEDRKQWEDPERERLLAEVEALQHALDARTGGLLEEMVAAKGRQLAAMSTPGAGRGATAATAELEQTIGRYMVEVRALLDDEADRLERLHLPRESLLALFDEIFARWVPQRSMETPAIPDEVVERFPEQAWWLLRPRAPAR
jgi:hypothetical protein